MRNRRVTKRYAGLTLKEWAEKTGKNYNTLKTRARRGNTIP
jgi:DNA-directed RNA polymerase specialized sigma24 family protein